MDAELVETAARIFCQEAMTDYRDACDKAARELGINPRRTQISGSSVRDAVVRYQRLFGGAEYTARLKALRATALRAMRLLADFDPRLTGAVVSGAITGSHRVQIHAFADKPEMVDWLLQERGIAYQVDERRYRFADGGGAAAPVLSFGEDDDGVDVSIFGEDQRRLAPLSSLDRSPMQRLTLAEAERLAAEG